MVGIVKMHKTITFHAKHVYVVFMGLQSNDSNLQ